MSCKVFGHTLLRRRQITQVMALVLCCSSELGELADLNMENLKIIAND
jgi:hypothetical protein